ncbi:MAG: hypothetical protein JRH01_26030, partial [Deltaproteobacteria bacterium]|nr:hypothetical protein [Deltaproteobacteria bacterium]
MARPTIYSEKLAESLLRRLADGETLLSICKSSRVPHRDTIRRWVRDKPDFRRRYLDARATWGDRLAEEVVEIADACEQETGPVSKARLQIDARKWAASRLNPIRWGDRTQLNIGARPEQEPLVISWEKPIEINWEAVPSALKERVETLREELKPYVTRGNASGVWSGKDFASLVRETAAPGEAARDAVFQLKGCSI